VRRLLAVFLAVGTAGSMTSAAAGAASEGAVVRPAEALVWSNNPAVKGASNAVLWGDPQTGAYGMLKRVPAGTTLAPHTHPYEHKVVIISGTIALWVDGAARQDLGPGSYALIPAGTQHQADCKPGADCVYLEQSPGKFEVHFVK
jgi:quercetin dioxygenase-like cupin family protein